MIQSDDALASPEVMPMWCQTGQVSENTMVAPEYGAHKWGQVDGDIDEDTGTFKGKQQITVFSSASPKQGYLNGSMKIQIIGDVSISNVIPLTNTGILTNQRMKIDVDSGIVGNPQVLRVFTSNKPNKPQLCKKIQVRLGYKIWEFPCSEMIFQKGEEGEDNIGVSLSLSKLIGQTMNMKVNQGCDDPIWVQISGDVGKTPKILITDSGFSNGETLVKFLGDYVGTIFKVAFTKQDGSKLLMLEELWISYTGNTGNKVLWAKPLEITTNNFYINPKPKPIRIELAAVEEEIKTDPPTPPAETETPTPEEIEAEEVKEVSPVQSKISFDGGCLNANIQATVKDVSCNDTFSNLASDFGEDFSIIKGKQFPNLKHIQVKCPENCIAGAPVIGLLLHPVDSNICTSAIADRALDHTGGIISIALTKAQLAQDYQFKTVTHYKIAVESVAKGEEQSSSVSFAIAKVDSPKFVAVNIRIIKDGNISVKGRLEIKSAGKWNTIITQDEVTPENNPNNNIANAACKYLGYVQGMHDPLAKSIPLHESVPQIKISCGKKANASFPCMLPVNQPETAAHAKDLFVECMDKDPTDTNKKDGTQSMDEGVFGAIGSGKQPVVQYANEPQVPCLSAFEKPEDPDAEDRSKTNADMFCQNMGQPHAVTGMFVKVDKSIGTDDIAALKNKPKFLLLLPDYDAGSKSFRSPSEEIIVDECMDGIVQVQCEGTAIPPVVSAKLLAVKRQNFPPPITLECIHSLQTKEPAVQDLVRGDPGSVFTFKCPANCMDIGELVGAGLYSHSSSICKAAIQQGMIDDSQPGIVSIVTGQPTFQLESGLTSNNIESRQYPAKDADTSNNCKNCVEVYTQAVAPTNSCQLYGHSLSSFVQEKSHIQKNKSIKIKTDNILVSKTSKDKFKSKKIQSKNKDLPYNLIKAKKLSFITPNTAQFNMQFNGKVPVFWQVPKWAENVNLLLDEDSNIDLSELPNANELRFLGDYWSMMFGIEFDDFLPDKAVIFDVGGPGCYQFIVNNIKDELKAPTFQFHKKEKLGSQNIFQSNYSPTVNIKYNIAIVFQTKEDSSTVTEFQIDGKKIVESAGKEFNEFEGCTNDALIKLGNDDQSHPFIGFLSQFVAFKTAISQEDLQTFMSAGSDRLIMPNLDGKQTGVTTTDGRPCIVQPTDLPIPGNPGSPAGPKQEGSFPANEAEKVETDESDNLPEAIKDGPATDQGGDIMTCTHKGTDDWGPLAAGQVKTKPDDFRITAKKIKCPVMCIQKTLNKFMVYGPAVQNGNEDLTSSQKYSLDSSICGSAIHAGIINNKDGGNVIQHLTKEVKGFSGLEQNGVISKPKDKSDSSIFIKNGPDPVVMDCTEKANKNLKFESGGKVGIECPKGCQSRSLSLGIHEVYGNPIAGQTMDSSVCLAAMHADVLSESESNQVIIQMFEKKTPEMFPCSVKVTGLKIPCSHRGVNAQSKKGTQGFLFKDSLQSCKYFNYKSNSFAIGSRFTKVVGKKNWTEENDKVLGMLISGPKGENDSKIIQDAFECGNASLIVNLRIHAFDENEPEAYIGVIFRQLKNDSVEEYQLLKIVRDRAELVKVTNGNEDFINKKDFNYKIVDENNIGVYSFQIQYLINKIDIQMRVEPSIVNTQLLSEDNYDIHRGKVGLAKFGNPDFEIDMFATKAPDYNANLGIIDVDSLIDSIKFTTNAVQGYCTKKFIVVADEFSKMLCNQAIGQCKQKLEEFKELSNDTVKESATSKCIKKFELVRKIEQENEKKKQSNACQQLIESGEEKVEQSKDAKIDYKPALTCDGEPNTDQFYPAWVDGAEFKKGADGIPDSCAFKVQYVCNLKVADGTFTEPINEVEGETDRGRLQKCGTGIASRGIVPADPVLKSKCTGSISMITDKDLMVVSKKKEWISKLVCC